jgi:hypothetical protein
MFELLRSLKIGGVIQVPAAALLFLPGSNLSIPSLQSAASLCSAASSGCCLRQADAPIQVKASKDSGAYADGCICIPGRLLIAMRR